MTINAYTFPLNNQSVFICNKEEITGQQWANECIALAQDINNYSEKNWLLYQDDFYQYSLYFFALLLANKNIILAQSNQLERFNQAAEFADISIGDAPLSCEQKIKPIPHFNRSNSAQSSSTLDDLSIDENICITLFTSGSTGEAKAIKKHWSQLANEIECLQQLFPREKNCVLSTVTHKHIYGLLFKLIWPVFTNKRIVCDTIEYPEQIEHFCRDLSNITLISSPSYLARTSGQLSTQATSNIVDIFCSGGALNVSVANEFSVLNQQIITEIYGSTETGGIAWRQQTKNAQWQLFPEHEVTLAQDSTLLLTSKFIAKGHPYKTDDRVALTGRFFNLLGRVDRIIKLHEKRLSLDEMEGKLIKVPKIKACHCFVLNKSMSKAMLVAVVELTPDCIFPENSTQKKQLIKEYKQALLSVFEPSLLPRKWRFVQKLPFNSEGKLVKAELINLFK